MIKNISATKPWWLSFYKCFQDQLLSTRSIHLYDQIKCSFLWERVMGHTLPSGNSPGPTSPRPVPGKALMGTGWRACAGL